MTVYLDVIWLLNFLFDALLLLFTAILIKRRIVYWRLALASLIASISVFGFVTNLAFLILHPAFKLVLSLVIVWIAFGFHRFRFFVRATLTFYLTTFLMGGGLIGLHYFFQYESIFSDSILLASVKGFGDPISWVLIMIGFPVLWYFSTKQAENWEMAKIQYDQTVSVLVKIQDYSLHLIGLVDSGNQLLDPISKLPIMIISSDSVRNTVPKPMIELTADSFLDGSLQIPTSWETRLRIVPCQTVGQEGELLLVFKPDFIEIEQKESDKKKRYRPKGYIAFSKHSLSTDQSFDCIVHPKMLTSIPVVTAS